MPTMRPLALALLVLPLASACQGVRTLSDPTLVLRTTGGSELGVSTDYGIVFLGRTARSGPLEVTAWFGDGPNIEKTVIEPVGSGLFTAETEIRLPETEMSFEEPAAGTVLHVVGRDAKGPWSASVTVQSDPRVLGIVTTVPDALRDAPDQIGAGVFTYPHDDASKRKLVGLVSGRLVLGDGANAREFLTVVGPTDLWRLVSFRREPPNKRRFVYREDVR